MPGTFDVSGVPFPETKAQVAGTIAAAVVVVPVGIALTIVAAPFYGLYRLGHHATSGWRDRRRQHKEAKEARLHFEEAERQDQWNKDHPEEYAAKLKAEAEAAADARLQAAELEAAEREAREKDEAIARAQWDANHPAEHARSARAATELSILEAEMEIRARQQREREQQESQQRTRDEAEADKHEDTRRLSEPSGDAAASAAASPSTSQAQEDVAARLAAERAHALDLEAINAAQAAEIADLKRQLQKQQ